MPATSQHFDFATITSAQRKAIKQAEQSAEVLTDFMERKVPPCENQRKAMRHIAAALKQINSALCFHGLKYTRG